MCIKSQMSTALAAIAMVAALLLETSTQQLIQVVNQPSTVGSAAQIARSERFRALSGSLNIGDFQESKNRTNPRVRDCGIG